ncbi:hypothetical protein P8452_31536 [Trifolium repens]|nr:hypothetical protein P8452_31536 [Trifolium repens]
MVSSARVCSSKISSEETNDHGASTEEEDILQKSTQRMNDKDENHQKTENKIKSYKEKLLNIFGDEVQELKCTRKHNEEMDLVDNSANVTPHGAGLAIRLVDEEWSKWSNPWRMTLAIKVMGKKVNFKVLESNLKRKWTKNGAITIVDMVDGYYMVHFQNKEDYDHALFEGPWLVADHYIIVQRWSPMFLQQAETSKKMAVWIRIPRLPLELYNSEFLGRIGSALGSMLKIDRLTSIHSRGKFARICVEIDLDKPLVPFIVIRGYKFPLEYEGLHLICFHCGRYGHKLDDCSDKLLKITEKETTNFQVPFVVPDGNPSPITSPENQGEETMKAITAAKTTVTDNNDRSEDYGPWMIARRNTRRKNQGSNKSGSQLENISQSQQHVAVKKPQINGTRFASLSEEETNILNNEPQPINDNNNRKEPNNNKPTLHVKPNIQDPNKNVNSNMDLSKGPQIHPIRIRNATGGKNPQNSNHSNGKDNKLTQQKSIKKKQVTPKMQNLSSSTPRTGPELQRKKEEFLMLEQMKIIQKHQEEFSGGNKF